MFIQETQKNIPHGWQIKKLSQVATFLDNERIPLESGERMNRQGNYPYYGASGIIDYIDECIFDGEYVLLGEDGANIIDRSSPLAFIARGKFWVNNHAHVLKPKENTNVYFLSEYLESLDYKKYNTGSAQPKLNGKTCQNIPVLLPPLPEQNRIVAVLETWDRAIETLTKKIEIKKQIKTGLMQKLLTGKTRLKGFSGKWFLYKLGEICDIKRGGSPRPIEDYITDDQDGYNWLRIGDVPTGDRYIYNTKEKIKKEGLVKTTLVKEGDFILSNSMSYGRPYIMKTTACIHDGWLALKDISPKTNANFLYYFLSSSRLQSVFSSISAGSGVQNLKKESVAEIIETMPGYEEQTTIARILTEADDEIGILEKKLSLFRDQKKYLLNTLITGEIRTPEDLTLYS